MKSLVLNLILTMIFGLNMCSAQNFTAVYELRQKIKDSIKTSTYFLDGDDKKSVFRSEMMRKSDSLKSKTGFGLGRAPSWDNQFEVSTDKTQDKSFKIIRAPLMRDIYSVPADKINWILSSEKKKIDSLDCQKVLCDYGGRQWTAWFAKDIQLDDGPYVFSGLPGLVIAVEDGAKEFAFQLVSIKKNPTVIPYEKGKNISWADYNKLRLAYFAQPFWELRNRNIPVGISDGSGGTKRLNPSEMKVMEDQIRKNLTESYHPLELNYRVDYK